MSSSGGIFTALSEVILENFGIVYGAYFASDFTVKHKRISSKDQLNLLRGAKYIQSDISAIYQEVKSDIKAEKTILFSGTPCQIAGLYGFLQDEDYPNFYTCDLVCHGVNSPSVFKAYLKYKEQKLGHRITLIDFRNKERGSWEEEHIKFSYGLDSEYVRWHRDPFICGFHKNLYLRPSCYSCRYARLPRIGDITLGDFWCWNRRKRPNHFNTKGTSLILINNNKGKKLFGLMREKFEGSLADLSKAILYNPNIIKPTLVPKDSQKRKIIFDLVSQSNYKVLFETVLEPKITLLDRVRYLLNNPHKVVLKVINKIKKHDISHN